MTTTGKVLLGLLATGALVGAGIFIYKGINSPANPASDAGNAPSAPAATLSSAEKQLWGNSYAKAKAKIKSFPNYTSLSDAKKITVNSFVDSLNIDDNIKRTILDDAANRNIDVSEAIQQFVGTKFSIPLSDTQSAKMALSGRG